MKLTLEYDGGAFAGWARQPGLRTVAGRARARARDAAAATPVTLTVAGRTDARRSRLGPGRELRTSAGEPAPLRALAERAAARTTSRCSRAGCPTASTRAATRSSRPTATGCWRGRRRARSSAAGRCGGRTASTEALATCAAALRARTTSRPSRRPRPSTCASSATSSSARWRRTRRRAGVLDRGRRLHAPHGPRAGRRRCWRSRAGGGTSEASRRLLEGAPRARPGPTAPPHGLYFARVRY